MALGNTLDLAPFGTNFGTNFGTTHLIVKRYQK